MTPAQINGGYMKNILLILVGGTICTALNEKGNLSVSEEAGILLKENYLKSDWSLFNSLYYYIISTIITSKIKKVSNTSSKDIPIFLASLTQRHIATKKPATAHMAYIPIVLPNISK